MKNEKTTKKGHIRYSVDLKEFLKTFISKDKSDVVLWNAINRANNNDFSSTLKNAFNPQKDKLTINIVQSLLVFVLKKQIDTEDVLLKLNALFTRFYFKDFTQKDKKTIIDYLQEKTSIEFRYYKIGNNDLLIFKKTYNEDYKPVQKYQGFNIKLNDISLEVDEIKSDIRYKKAIVKTKDKKKNEIKSKIKVYNEIFDEILPVFVGREFVFDKIDKFISKNNKGYFYIKADPGIGKTSLAIKLVEDKEYPFHIINPQHNGTGNSVKDFISNICAQLIVKHNLPIEQFPKDYDLDGDFLYSILRLVSKKNDNNEKIVIVIDGLDELKQEELTFFTKETILHFPKILPQNIFFVITMRKLFQKGIKLPTSEVNEEFFIEDLSEENIKDIREYIENAVQDKRIEEYLKKKKISKKEFLKTLEKKSEGNFMYLKYIFREILNGNYKDITLTELPQGLNGYYKEHWDRMMTVSDEVKEVKLKTIYVLSNMEEPISSADLTEIIKSDDETVKYGQIREIINDWFQFLKESIDENGENEYTFYHKSFLDFLASDDIIKTIGKDYSKIAERIELDFYDKNIDSLLEEDDII